jgi:SAM-dependent methyltransferase
VTAPEFSYAGSELELFRSATNWKTYYSEKIQPFIGDDVLEVGAGIGGTTAVLCRPEHESWVCLEPDPQLCRHIQQLIDEQALPPCCSARGGTTASLETGQKFDTILYIDVLEHIEQDRDELASAARLLKPGGYLVVLAPAHQFLFSPFDQAVGHFRRYTDAGLRALTPPGSGLAPVSSRYLDACGIVLSMANRALLKKDAPTPKNIEIWDRYVIPVSRVIDPLLRYKVGKSVVVVWQMQPAGP